MIFTNQFDYHFIPSKRASEKLMIVLHGRGDSFKPFKHFNEELKLNDFNFLLLNAPRKYLDGFSWYSLEKQQNMHIKQIRQKLFLLIDELKEQGWKPKNIFLFGFSQGCLVSCDFALNYPGRLGGVIGVSGYFHFFPNWKSRLSRAAKKTRWLLTHGRQDDVLDINETLEGVIRIRKAGVPVDWIELDKEHTMEDNELDMIRQWVRQCC